MSAVATSPPSRDARRVAVGRGRWVTIRQIEASDADGLFAFYAGLSPEARQSRFLGAAKGIHMRTAHRFAGVDHLARDGVVAVLHEVGAEDGSIVGHACLEPIGSGTEEIAFAVADGLRRLGIGTELMTASLESARRRGVRRLTASTFATNEPMRRLGLHAGPPMESRSAHFGVTELDWNLAA